MKTFKNQTKDKGFFKTFIPLEAINGSYIIEKDIGNGKSGKFLVGQASNLKTDKDQERVGKKFLEKMKSTALGLNVFSEHKHSLEKTLGFVSDVGGGDEFIAETALEPEEENNLVKSVISKLNHGTKLGYSIGGRVTEVGKVFDDDLGKDIDELVDGELYELSITAMPSGFDTWVTPIMKSMHEFADSVETNGEEQEEVPVVKDVKVFNELEFVKEWSTVSKVDTNLTAHRKKFKLTSKQMDALSSMHKAGVDDKTILDAFKAFSTHNKNQAENSVVGNLMLAWSTARELNSKKHLTGHIGEQRNKMGITVGQMDILSNKYLDGSLGEYELEDMVEHFQKVNEFIHSGVDEKRNFLELVKIIDELSESDSINDQLYDLFWTFRSAIYRVMYDDDMEPAAKKSNINTISGEFSTKVESLSARLAELTAEVESQLA